AGIVRDGDTGWLVEPDDREALTGGIVDAVDDAEERERRAEAARRDACDRFSWPALAGVLAETLDDVAATAKR
ncbi:MAG: glycosyl transferase family 1, partial [Actinomycetota bacterium]|nr:glycosyl transferase family 1 [Actinomycetota bacterium]